MFRILKKLFGRKDAEAPHTGERPNAADETEAPRDRPVSPEKTPTRQTPPERKRDEAAAPESFDSGHEPVPRPEKEGRRKKKARRGKKGRQPQPPRNRHGIPVFSRNADIEQLLEKQPDSPAPEHEREGRAEAPGAPPRRKVRRIPRNKHGIPVFGEDTDVSFLFRAASSRPASGESGAYPSDIPGGGPGGSSGPDPRESNSDNFEALLDASLSGKGIETLLREKSDASPEEVPMTPEQKIRQYPPPQDELDLHGHTSREAVAATRAFVEKSIYRGKRTLLIIVGKGLHSEGRAILPDVVETELACLKQEGKVLAHRWERGAKRKSGAIIVYLNPI